MADDGPLWDHRYLDWTGMQRVFPDHDDVAGWTWVRAQRCPMTGEVVHYYRHCASRRFLRLDVHGRPYAEDDDGAPIVVEDPGAMLLVFIAEALGPFPHELPSVIRIPDVLRIPAQASDPVAAPAAERGHVGR